MVNPLRKFFEFQWLDVETDEMESFSPTFEPHSSSATTTFALEFIGLHRNEHPLHYLLHNLSAEIPSPAERHVNAQIPYQLYVLHISAVECVVSNEIYALTTERSNLTYGRWTVDITRGLMLFSTKVEWRQGMGWGERERCNGVVKNCQRGSPKQGNLRDVAMWLTQINPFWVKSLK